MAASNKFDEAIFGLSRNFTLDLRTCRLGHSATKESTATEKAFDDMFPELGKELFQRGRQLLLEDRVAVQFGNFRPECWRDCRPGKPDLPRYVERPDSAQKAIFSGGLKTHWKMDKSQMSL